MQYGYSQVAEIMKFQGYGENWDETKSYPIDSRVYYKTHHYIAAANCSPGENPITAMHDFEFSPGDYGFGDRTQTFTKSLRKWVLTDYPVSGIYYAMIMGHRGNPGKRSNPSGFPTLGYSNQCMVLNVVQVGVPNEDQEPYNYNWKGYGQTWGLSVNFNENYSIKMLSHISFIPIDTEQFPFGGMPRPMGDVIEEGTENLSYLNQVPSVNYNGWQYEYGGPIEGASFWHVMAYATFGRAHEFTTLTGDVTTVNSPVFADGFGDLYSPFPYPAQDPEDPPPEDIGSLTDLNPEHPE